MRGHFDYEFFGFPPFGHHFIDHIGFDHGRFGHFHGPPKCPDFGFRKHLRHRRHPFGGHGNSDHQEPGYGPHGHRYPHGHHGSECRQYESGSDDNRNKRRPEYHHRSSCNPEDSDHSPDHHRRGPHHRPKSPRRMRRFDHSPEHGVGGDHGHCKRFGPRRCFGPDCDGRRDRHGFGPWMHGRPRRPHPYSRPENLYASDCEECQDHCCSKKRDKPGKICVGAKENIPSCSKDKDDNVTGDTILVQRIVVEKASRPKSV